MAMDDLSDDGVSPPEWQSGSEREPEDDKEIEGNEPDEIPPSDPDSYVCLKEAENNGQWLQCIGKSVEKLPSYDGFLETQLSGMRVPFHNRPLYEGRRKSICQDWSASHQRVRH